MFIIIEKMNRHLMLTQKIVHHTIGIQTTEYKEIIYGFNRNVTGLPFLSLFVYRSKFQRIILPAQPPGIK